MSGGAAALRALADSPQACFPGPDGASRHRAVSRQWERRVWWKEQGQSSDTPALASCWHPRSQLRLVNTEVAHHGAQAESTGPGADAWSPPRSTPPAVQPGLQVANLPESVGDLQDGAGDRAAEQPHRLGPGSPVDLSLAAGTGGLPSRKARRPRQGWSPGLHFPGLSFRPSSLLPSPPCWPQDRNRSALTHPHSGTSCGNGEEQGSC